MHRLDQINAKKPAKLLNSKSLTLDFSRQQIWPVFLCDPTGAPIRVTSRPRGINPVEMSHCRQSARGYPVEIAQCLTADIPAGVPNDRSLQQLVAADAAITYPIKRDVGMQEAGAAQPSPLELGKRVEQYRAELIHRHRCGPSRTEVLPRFEQR